MILRLFFRRFASSYVVSGEQCSSQKLPADGQYNRRKFIMKTIFATLIATAALIGVAQAETVTGTLRSFDQVTGTIVLDNGMAYGIDMTDENSEDLIKPIANGSTVTIDVDSGSRLVNDIYASS